MSSAATITTMTKRYCNSSSLRPSLLYHRLHQHQLHVKSVRRRSATFTAARPLDLIQRSATNNHHHYGNAFHLSNSTITWRFLSNSPTNRDDDNNSKHLSVTVQLLVPTTNTTQSSSPLHVKTNVTLRSSSTSSSSTLSRLAAEESKAMIVLKYTSLLLPKQQQQQQRAQRCTFSSTRDSTITDNTTNQTTTTSSTTTTATTGETPKDSTNKSTKATRKKKQQPRVFRKRDVNNPEYLRQRQERMDIVLTSFRNNTIISIIKLMAWLHSGSSSMLAELIHSLVDSFNQGLLLVGHYYSGSVADRQHPYGYGKSVYFWSLVSALGTFFGGAGLSFMHSYHELMHPSLQTITWHVWGVLAISFLLDGQVLVKASKKFLKDKKKGDSIWSHLQKTRDPFNLAMLLEDGAACTGVLIAIAGIYLSHTYQNPIYDGLGGVGISCLLGAVGIILAGFNHRFLLGQAVDAEIVKGIHDIIMKQRSIDGIRSVQTQWIGPDSFSYKAEVDFDGTYIAAKLLPSYLGEFSKAKLEIEHELRVLLSFYTEDVLRMVEQEVRSIEAEIRLAYPGAEYIELEPMSKDLDELYLDESKTEELKHIELEALRSHEESLQSADDTLHGDTEEFVTPTSSSTSSTTTTMWDDTKKL